MDDTINAYRKQIKHFEEIENSIRQNFQDIQEAINEDKKLIRNISLQVVIVEATSSYHS